MIGLILAAQIFLATYAGEMTDGTRKVCYYDTPQGVYTVNVRASEMCPMTIEVDLDG